jgi:hypothetical protein
VLEETSAEGTVVGLVGRRNEVAALLVALRARQSRLIIGPLVLAKRGFFKNPLPGADNPLSSLPTRLSSTIYWSGLESVSTARRAVLEIRRMLTLST